MILSFVKKATVECIDGEDIKVGDHILWSKNKAKVVSKSHHDFVPVNSKNYARIQLFPEDEENIIAIPRYRTFLRIIDCELERREV